MLTRQQRAEKDIALKLKLEERIKPALDAWFNSVSEDIRVHWAVNRTLPDLRADQASMKAILNTQYKQVQRAFYGATRSHLAKKYDRMEWKSESEDAIAMALYLFWQVKAEEQAARIVATTTAQAQAIANKVVIDAATHGKTLTPSEEADQIQSNFDDLTTARVDAIARTETQSSAEKSKAVEASAISATLIVNREPDEENPDNPTAGGTSKGLFKTWHSVLIPTTREWHAEADGQRIAINRPFMVMGEEMMYPGDDTNATAANLVNCLCTAVYDDEQN